MISSIRGRRPNIIVLDDIGLEVKPLADFVFYGGGKGGIVFDPKTNSISHKFSNTLQNGEERKKFARLYNELYKEFNENNAYIQKKLKRAK